MSRLQVMHGNEVFEESGGSDEDRVRNVEIRQKL